MRYIYLLRCSDDTLYTGITNNLEKRVFDHNHSKTGAKYTKSRRPVTLLRSQEVSDRNEATKIELQIKKYPKQKKESLIQGS